MVAAESDIPGDIGNFLLESNAAAPRHHPFLI